LDLLDLAVGEGIGVEKETANQCRFAVVNVTNNHDLELLVVFLVDYGRDGGVHWRN